MGDLLPSAPELCARFGVSRITLRRAVSDLCEQGQGTIVAQRKIQQALVSLSGFSEVMQGTGRSVRHVVLAREDGIEDEGVSAILALGPGSRPIRFLRLATADDRPVKLERLHLDVARYPGVCRPVAEGGSFLKALKRAHDEEPSAAEQVFDVGFPSPEERAHLRIPGSQSVWQDDKTIFGRTGDAIAHSRLVTPTHLVTYTVRS